MAAIVSTIILATAAGAWAELRYGGRAAMATRRALIFVLYVVLPPITFFNLARAEFDADIGIGIGLAYSPGARSALVAWFVASRLLGLRRPAVGAVICCTLVANTGYLGYPLVAALLGFDQLVGGRDLRHPGSAPGAALGAFSVGAAFGERAGETPRERVMAFFVRNPPLYAAVAGAGRPRRAGAGRRWWTPRAIAIVALLPLGFFAVGAALAEEAEEGTSSSSAAPRRGGRGGGRPAAGGRAGAALLARAAADRPPRPLPAARRDALRHQHDDRHPRLRPRPADRRGHGGLVDRDRGRGCGGLAGPLNSLRVACGRPYTPVSELELLI